jgi:hypothetical protein
MDSESLSVSGNKVTRPLFISFESKSLSSKHLNAIKDNVLDDASRPLKIKSGTW